MLRFALINRILKFCRKESSGNYFEIVYKKNNNTEESYFYKAKRGFDVELSEIVSLYEDNFDKTFVFESMSFKNKAISIKNVLNGAEVDIHPGYPSEDSSFLSEPIEEYILKKVGDEQRHTWWNYIF